MTKPSKTELRAMIDNSVKNGMTTTQTCEKLGITYAKLKSVATDEQKAALLKNGTEARTEQYIASISKYTRAELKALIDKCITDGMSVTATHRFLGISNKRLNAIITPKQKEALLENAKAIRAEGMARTLEQNSSIRTDGQMVVVSDPAEIAAITRQVAANLPLGGRYA